MKKIIVREVTLKDVDGLISLGSQWLNPLYDKSYKQALLERIIRMAETNVNHMIYVVELDDKLVAFCDFILWMDWLTNKKRLIIQHVYMDEKYRNQKLGFILLSTILEDFKPDFAVVDTKPEKFPYAEKLYAGLGFSKNSNRIWMEKNQE